MKPRRSGGDVQWHLPGSRRPFATSTAATSYLIVAHAAEGRTVSEARRMIAYDPEAAAVLDGYIAAGYADHRLTDLGVR